VPPGLLAVPMVGAAAVMGLTALTHAVGGARTYSVQDVPATPVAIVLGAQVHPGGVPSGFLEARLRLAAELWHTGKVRAIVVSGDDGPEHHREADSMRAWLVANGVPATVVVCDPDGHDTFATMARAVGVYGLEEAIVVSQSYHLPRAISTARALGLDAYGVGDSSASRWGRCWRRGQAREVLANLKMVGELLTRERPTTADNSVLEILTEPDDVGTTGPTR